MTYTPKIFFEKFYKIGSRCALLPILYYICSLKENRNKMNKCRELILQYSNDVGVFDTETLWNWIKDKGVTSMNTINSTLSKMVEESVLSRVAKGCYATVDKKGVFKAEPLENEKDIFVFLKEKLPFAKICVYNGNVIAPLQHHVSENNITYVEVDRDITESVFELLKQTFENVWLLPNADMVSRYIDLKNKGLIVKVLVTESPVEEIDGITVPTLEKLLVDIIKDPDFSYMQGTEAEKIWENARELYIINESRLKRYARRRGLKLRDYD